ncbi:MAG: hypothetical protein ACYCOU_07385 [Sulfobacillus sp.]
MIDYDKTNRSDILRIIDPRSRDYGCEIGDLVRVLERTEQGVRVEKKDGGTVEFVFNCGAARLEPTEWTGDFDIKAAATG